MIGRFLPLLLSAMCGSAAFGANLPSFDFEQGTEGWVSGSPAGQVTASTDAQHVRAGKSSLEYRYQAQKGDIPFLAVTVPQGLGGMRSLQLDVRTDSPTAVLVALVEEGGSRYQYITATPAGWLHLTIDVSEFARADDTPDVNGRLDLDQVHSLAFGDLLAIWSTADTNLAALFGERPGQHAFWLDNVTASDQPVLPPAPPGQVVVDDFRSDNLSWLPLASVSVAVGSAPAGGQGRALRVEYPRVPGKLAGIIRFVNPGRLAGMTRLTFSATARSDTSLFVALEEVGGARYVALVPLPAGGPPQASSLALTHFKLSDDSHDANAQLDPEAIKSIAFADIAGLTDPAAAGANAFWLQQVHATVQTGALQSR